MTKVSVVEAKSQSSTLLAAVEAGEEIAVTRHGRAIERLAPDRPHIATEAFRDFWDSADIDLQAPPDALAEEIRPLD